MEPTVPIRPSTAGDGGDVRGQGDGHPGSQCSVDLAGSPPGGKWWLLSLKNTEIFLSVGGGGERGEGEEDLVRREERASGAADPGPRSRG